MGNINKSPGTDDNDDDFIQTKEYFMKSPTAESKNTCLGTCLPGGHPWAFCHLS